MAYTKRSSVARRFQIGVSAADTSLPTLKIGIAPAGDAFKEFRPAGGQYVGQTQLGNLWSEGPINGGMDFNELTYLLGGNIGHEDPVATSPAGGFIWVGESPVNEDMTVEVYEAEMGETGAVEVYPEFAIPDLSLSMGRTSGLESSGKAFGAFGTFATTLTSATELPQKPANGLKLGFWTGTSFADLASSPDRLDPKGYKATFTHNGVWVPDFVTDDSVASYDGLVGGEITTNITMSIAYDVATSDLKGPATIAKMLAGDYIFLRMKVTGGLVATGIPFSFTLDACCQISAPPKLITEGNIMAWEWTFIPVVDPTTGVRFQYELVNQLASL